MYTEHKQILHLKIYSTLPTHFKATSGMSMLELAARYSTLHGGVMTIIEYDLIHTPLSIATACLLLVLPFSWRTMHVECICIKNLVVARLLIIMLYNSITQNQTLIFDDDDEAVFW